MDITVKLTPGYTFQPDELITPDKLNQAANPTIQLTGGDVGTLLLADNSVTTPKLADGCLSADSPGRAKMADGYVTTAKLSDSAVTAPKIANGAVTSLKIGASAVDATKLADQAVTMSKLAPDVFATVAAKAAPVAADSLVLSDSADSGKTKLATITALASLVSSGLTRMAMGQYAGAGGTGQVTVSGLGFAPDIVLVVDENFQSFSIAFNQGARKFHTSAFDWTNSAAAWPACVFGADGFSVKANWQGVSQNGRTYNYLALKVT